MLPHIAGRPVTMERYPAGIDKKGFIQKDVSKGFPDWLQRVEISKRSGAEDDGAVHYPLVDDARALLWLANQNTITPHVWTSRVPQLHRPDLCVFDLDPSDDQAGGAARGGPRGARSAGRAGPGELRQDLRLEGISHPGRAGRRGRLRAGPALLPGRRRGAGEAPPGAVHAGVHQGRSRRAHLRRHRPQRLRRHLRGGLRPAPEARRARVGALRLAGDRARRCRSPDVHAAHNGRPPRRGRATSGGRSTTSRIRCATPPPRLERLLTDEDWKESLAATTRRPVSRKMAKRPSAKGRK